MKHWLWLSFLCASLAKANCPSLHNAEFIIHGATPSQAVQMDFARHPSNATCYWEAWPNSLSALSALVKTAYRYHLPIRTQGAAHSLHGHALPLTGELLIHTNRLNQVSFNRIGTVTASAGVPIRWLQLRIQDNSSFILPVANGGGIAPTVGGYLAAGGISPDSARYGGFWEHVSEIKLVIENGKILTVNQKDPLFPWLFGAQGELGIIAQVTLKLRRDEEKPFHYPLHLTVTSPNITSNGYTWQTNTSEPSLFWFNVFTTNNQVNLVKAQLNTWMKTYPDALRYREPYVWRIERVSFIPPLVFNQNTSFVAIGLWGEKGQSAKQFSALHSAFSRWVRQRHFAHYGQVESFDRLTLNAKTHQIFLRYKHQLDPAGLFNQSSLFNSK